MLDIIRCNSFNNMFQVNGAFLLGRMHMQKNLSYPKKSSYKTYKAKTSVNASSIINPNSSTDIIDVATLEDKVSPLINFLEVADSNGRIYCVDRNINTACWLKIVSIANDCQSSNVELMANADGVYLKSIKRIVPGEPLLMWFEANVLAMIDMPYLTRSNIKGENDYVCHKCNDHFEHPNPLKIHIMTSCSQLGENYLWSQLVKHFQANIAPQPQPPLNPFDLFSEKIPMFHFEPPRTPPMNLSSSRYSPVSDSGVSLILGSSLISSGSSDSPSRTSSSSSGSSNQASPPSPRKDALWLTSSPVKRLSEKSSLASLAPRHSAFKPYSYVTPKVVTPALPSPTVQLALKPAPVTISPPLPPVALPMPTPPIAESHQLALLPPPSLQESVSALTANAFAIRPRAPPAPDRPDAGAAHMETVVSNMGKSKEGHICIYCGKVYSRKYGLKIHIRTHTGYKPLKCKFCDRPFGDPSNLNKHVRLHADGNTPYKCDLCDKVLVRRRDLERHMKSRHAEHADLSDHHHLHTDDSELSDA